MSTKEHCCDDCIPVLLKLHKKNINQQLKITNLVYLIIKQYKLINSKLRIQNLDLLMSFNKLHEIISKIET